MNNRYYLKSFTLIEIMIVVAIIAILIAVALPAYLTSSKNSQKAVCIANLEKIDSAIDRWAIENHIQAGSSVSQADEEDIFTNYVKGGKPRCPAGGEYAIYSVGSNPQVTCSREDAGHALPQ